jgi:hypothetical protein
MRASPRTDSEPRNNHEKRIQGQEQQRDPQVGYPWEPPDQNAPRHAEGQHRGSQETNPTLIESMKFNEGRAGHHKAADDTESDQGDDSPADRVR